MAPGLYERPDRVSYVRLKGKAPEAPRETYLEALARFTRETPDDIFLDHEGRYLSYGEIDRLSTRMANGLAARGVAKGDRVVTLIENSDDLVLVFFAINKLGAIWVPINTAYKGAFLRHQVADAEAALAICEADYVDNLVQVAPDLPALTEILVRGPVPLSSGRPHIGSLDLIRDGAETPIDLDITPEDLAALVYTSGTTGASKGCMVSHAYLCSMARQRNRCIPLEPTDITWSCLPLSHIAALGSILIANLVVGRRISVATRFSVSGFWDEIERSGATSIMLMASMFPLLAQAPDTPAMLRCRGQIRAVTGVPLSAGDRKIWEERFGVEYMMSFAYGQTEANIITMQPRDGVPPPLASMGPASGEFEIMVVDDDNRPVPIGETGELVVRPTRPGVMFSGYWRRPEDTLKAMRDLWWHTGDFARMDDDGFLYFVDRKKDYLRSRGENISSFEVESALMKHDAVVEAVCYSVAAKGQEDDLKTAIVLAADAVLSERELFLWARDNLPYFAVPRFVEFRADFPKTPTGRVQKQQLREEGITAATWDAFAEKLEIRRVRR